MDSFLILNIVFFSLEVPFGFLLDHLILCIMFMFYFTFVNEYVTSLLKSCLLIPPSHIWACFC